MFQRAGVIVYRAASALAVIVILRALLQLRLSQRRGRVHDGCDPVQSRRPPHLGRGPSAYQFLSRI